MKPIEKRAVPMSPFTLFLCVAFGVLFARRKSGPGQG